MEPSGTHLMLLGSYFKVLAKGQSYLLVPQSEGIHESYRKLFSSAVRYLQSCKDSKRFGACRLLLWNRAKKPYMAWLLEPNSRAGV